MTSVSDVSELQDIAFVKVLDYEIAQVDLNTASAWAIEATKQAKPKLLVTLNPEIVVQAESNSELKEALQAADFTVADGVGLSWAAKRFGHNISRVAGVELCEDILKKGGASLSVYFLGSKEPVAQKAAEKAKAKYGTVVAGFHHGYFDKNNCDELLNDIANSKAQFLIAGLGEGQELFLHKNRHKLKVPLMIGAGGTLDVLSGNVKRSPVWSRQLRLEWAHRIAGNPKRWYRLPRLIRFLWFVLSHKK